MFFKCYALVEQNTRSCYENKFFQTSVQNTKIMPCNLSQNWKMFHEIFAINDWNLCNKYTLNETNVIVAYFMLQHMPLMQMQLWSSPYLTEESRKRFHSICRLSSPPHSKASPLRQVEKANQSVAWTWAGDTILGHTFVDKYGFLHMDSFGIIVFRRLYITALKNKS